MSTAVRRKKSLIARMNVCIMDNFLQNKRCNHIFYCIFSIQRNVLLKKINISLSFLILAMSKNRGLKQQTEFLPACKVTGSTVGE